MSKTTNIIPYEYNGKNYSIEIKTDSEEPIRKSPNKDFHSCITIKENSIVIDEILFEEVIKEEHKNKFIEAIKTDIKKL